jgi:ribosomal protein S14
MTLLSIKLYKSHIIRKHVAKRIKRSQLLKYLFDVIHYSKMEQVSFEDQVSFNEMFYNHFTKIKRTHSISRVRSICQMTGRESAVSGVFRLSRQQFHTHMKIAKQFTGVARYPYIKMSRVRYANLKRK